MYQQGWTNDRLGLASATAWAMFVIIVAGGAWSTPLHRAAAGERALTVGACDHRAVRAPTARGARHRGDGAARRPAHTIAAPAGSPTLCSALVALLSVFPLYYTVVMASHTNAEMAAARRRCCRRAALFDNMQGGAASSRRSTRACSTR